MHTPNAIEVSVTTEVSDDVIAAFRAAATQLSASAGPLARDALEEIVAASCNAVLLARDTVDGGKIIGALTLVVFHIPSAVRAWIEDVVVDSSARGRGVGEALTREALRIAIERGAQTVDLTSRPSRATARRLYEKMGFAVRETNVYRYVPPGPGGPGYDCPSL